MNWRRKYEFSIELRTIKAAALTLVICSALWLLGSLA
jgi:hypothetical protein